MVVARNRFPLTTWLALLFFVAAGPNSVTAQEAGPESKTPSPQEDGEATTPAASSEEEVAERSIPQPATEQALFALDGSLRATQEALGAARAKLVRAPSQNERRELETEIKNLRAEEAELRRKFESIASGVDLTPFENPEREKFNLRNEVESLLEPLVSQLKSATEGPRVIEHLRSQLALYEHLSELSGHAVKGIETQLEQAPAELQKVLKEAHASVLGRHQSVEQQRQVTAFELESKLSARKPFLESTGNFFDAFFRSRGLNLLIGVGAFLVVFLTLRIFHRRILSPIYVKKDRSFYTRAANVLFHLFTIVAAVATVLLALFAVSDWILLVLVLLFLVGVGWAFVQMIPHFFEQLRMLLNLGSVRERECVILNGLPWRVDALMLHTRLVNPQLTGGELRIPVRDLINLHSRPVEESETWFPCSEGDWVILSDGTRGKVTLQTPDMVQLALPGGGYVTHQTTAFLGLSPRNLSAGFRVEIAFGIDYAHQSQSTEEIPKLMGLRLQQGIRSLVAADEINRLEVEFKEAAASSLDYEVQGDFKGSAADRYEQIQRLLARILVESCNEHGWVIPFTQLTVHQA